MSNISIKRQLTHEERDKLSLYSDFVAHLLFHRGITDSKQADKFLNPNYDLHSHPAESLADIDKAVSRVQEAIKNGETICIYGDYDADGIPGSVIMSEFFDKIGYTNFFVYIPHRNREGFGLNTFALDIIKDKGTTLIITIDCASANVFEVEYANNLRMDVIITDHHEVPEILPDAYALVNPKRSDCNYPEKMLCGSGVIYKVIQHLIKRGEYQIHKGWEKWLLDMVGIATISDMVPLIGENRIFAYYGLEVLKKTRRPGLLKLFNLRKINQKSVSEDDISFLITPQINAASRMGEPILAYNLLTSKTESDADVSARELMRINDRRKVEVTKIVKEINKHIKDKGHNLPVIAYGNPNWQPSLMGLVCSKIAEEYRKPVFLWGRGDGVELKGSCRTWDGISVYELMNYLGEEFFIQYGGHGAAGGFVIRPEKVSEFEDKLAEYLTEHVPSDHAYECDMNVHIDELNDSFVKEVEKLAPYGMANPKPLFAIKGVAVGVRNFGSAQNHFEISLKKTSREIVRAIAFFKTTDSFREVREGEEVTIIGYVEKNYFAGRFVVQVKVVDIL
jgi:single-stranded-DNA-specific exonuclease